MPDMRLPPGAQLVDEGAPKLPPGARLLSSVPGMEKLGGVPPAAGTRPQIEELKPDAEQSNPFLTSPNGLIRGGLRRAVHGVEAAAEPGWNAKFRGGSEIMRGLGTAALPAAIPAAIASPLPAAVGLGLGTGAQLAVEHGLPHLGASPEASAFAGDVAGIPAGGGGARLARGLRGLPREAGGGTGGLAKKIPSPPPPPPVPLQ